MNQRLPMLQIFRRLARSTVQACPDRNWRRGTLVAFRVTHLAGESRQQLQDVSGEGLVQLDQSRAHRLFQSAFQTWQYHAVEIGIIQLPQSQRKNQLAPLVAYREHLRDESLAFGEIAIAMQQHCAKRFVQRVVVASKLHEGL